MPPDRIYLLLHMFVAALALSGVVIWTIIAWRYRSAAIFWAAALYLINVFVFSTLRLTGVQLDYLTLNTWSLGIRLQGVLTITGAGLALIIGWDKYHE